MKRTFSIKIALFAAFFSLFFLNFSKVYAHPGNTAADGCHYCRTNCSKWGVPEGERHCHGGSTTSTSIKTTATAKPTMAPTAKPKLTVIPTPTIVPTPTLIPTPSPLEVTPTPEPSPEVSPEPVTEIVPEVLGATDEASNSAEEKSNAQDQTDAKKNVAENVSILTVLAGAIYGAFKWFGSKKTAS